MDYPIIYFDDDEQSSRIGWVICFSNSFYLDEFSSKEDAEKFLADYKKGLIYHDDQF